MNQSEQEFLRPEQAAEFLQTNYGQGTVRTLNKLRCVGGGPKFRKIGSRRVVYQRGDLITWIESKISAPLANTSAAKSAV